MRTTILPSTSLPPWNIKFALYQFIIVIQYLSMVYQSHHCSALPASLSSCTLCLALSILFPFILSVPFPFHAPFLFSIFQLLHTTSFYMPKSLSTTTPISSLFGVFILSMHLLHPPCTMPMHSLQHAMVLFLDFFTATPLFLCFARLSINTLSMFCMFTLC
jgi:hypothetical protein